MKKIDSRFIKTSNTEDDKALFTAHYINEVLPQEKDFIRFKATKFFELVEQQNGLQDKLSAAKGLKETPIEDLIIRPVLESLGSNTVPRVSIPNGEIDLCAYDPDNEIFPPQGFDIDFSNTFSLIEAKRYGRITNKYFVTKQDHTDPIFQIFDYLRYVNLHLANKGLKNKSIDYGVLTDGYKWRIYSKNYIHNVHDFAAHFIEFNLEEILNCEDSEYKSYLLKIFGYFFSGKSLSGNLTKLEKKSKELEIAVTDALREQTFTSLEYIATGLWRQLKVNPNLKLTLDSKYGIDYNLVDSDEQVKARLLKLVYDESLVFLLRTLFVLYAEDRNLFDQSKIRKVIKGDGNILERITSYTEEGIGQATSLSSLSRNDDISLGEVFTKIDDQYNGGLFSATNHPLLYMLDMDDDLYINAIDNLCRVENKKKIYTVDFSTISARELGSIYESLLEYKLTISEDDILELPSIVNKKRIRKNVKSGDLYLINHKGERKATGSYYTPDLIVIHLVKNTLDPKLDAIAQRYSTFTEIYDAVLELSVCDPAMGSGHMVYACFNRIIEFLHQLIEQQNENGDSSIQWNSETAYEIRANVARKCVYGSDLNPTAVELAKLVMWMSIFNADKPFEFFDYNLTCGNSLIGLNEETEEQVGSNEIISSIFGETTAPALLRSTEEMEASVQATLIQHVNTMQNMPRNTVDEVHKVDTFWRTQVLPLQKNLSFMWNIKLATTLLSAKTDQKKIEVVRTGYPTLIELVDENPLYIQKVLDDDADVPSSVLKLKPIAQMIEETYRPVHWRVMFPHIMMRGGFDVICANPPWDKVKPTRGEYFSDFIERYNYLETKDAKAASEALMAENQQIKDGWILYDESFKRQNEFFAQQFQHQIAYNSEGKKLSGDNNLFKLFLEKIYTLLKTGGSCGIVIPDNFNIDNGCTGLRRLILNQTTLRELIMFENRKKLFEIHGQYKFNVMSFDKVTPRANAAFKAGFYWHEPAWLDGEPTPDFYESEEKNHPRHHRTYSYSTSFIREVSPDTLTIFEFGNERQKNTYQQLLKFPKLSDDSEQLHVKTYRELDMTNDADIFTKNSYGWPLYQGGMVHHFDASFKPAERFVEQSVGEQRLANKWRTDTQKLPGRKYRIAWRSIAQPTDTRSLICTILPRGTFVGNSLNLIEIQGEQTEQDYPILSGLNVVMSSTVADFFIRQRIAKNVNAFMVKELPVPRDLEKIRELGQSALGLYSGLEFEKFRNGVEALTDERQRLDLRAKLDAEVARLYLLNFEQYQSVLNSFPLVDPKYKQRCLMEYKEIQFAS